MKPQRSGLPLLRVGSDSPDKGRVIQSRELTRRVSRMVEGSVFSPGVRLLVLASNISRNPRLYLRRLYTRLVSVVDDVRSTSYSGCG